MSNGICYNANMVVMYLKKTNVFYSLNVEGKNLSFLRCGGNVDIVAYPKNENEVIALISFLIANNIPYFVLGGGSNTLIKDGGFKGVAVSLKKFNSFTFNGTLLTASSGAMLPKLALECACRNIHGLAPLSGIPCSIGGATLKNAGCYGQETANLVDKVICYDTLTENIISIPRKDIPYSYRSSGSAFLRSIIIKVVLRLSPTPIPNHHDIAYYRAKRLATQPSSPSLGSVFLKTKLNVPAAVYIDKAELKGTRIGGAEISNKHANFIINNGSATAQNYLDLVELIKKVVHKKYNISLKEEIDIIGEN